MPYRGPSNPIGFAGGLGYQLGCFEATGQEVMQYTAFFVGVLSFLQALRWGPITEDKDTVKYGSGILFASAFPGQLPRGLLWMS